MKSLSKSIKYNKENLAFRLFQIKKRAYQVVLIKEVSNRKVILFIVGCQRSGTNLIERIFERDFRTKVYSEFSKLSSLDTQHHIRLNPLQTVKKEIEKNRSPLIVIRPLVETQNILKLLDYFDTSKALWMYRHYRDVASSNLKNFGIRNGINNLRTVVRDDPQNWRSENVSHCTKEIVAKHFSEDMNPYDAAALFWFVRNKLFFDLHMGKNSHIKICRYEDLVTKPEKIVKDIYGFIGYDYPLYNIVNDVHARSTEKGKDTVLSSEIEALCEALLNKLDVVYQSKQHDT